MLVGSSRSRCRAFSDALEGVCHLLSSPWRCRCYAGQRAVPGLSWGGVSPRLLANPSVLASQGLAEGISTGGGLSAGECVKRAGQPCRTRPGRPSGTVPAKYHL